MAYATLKNGNMQFNVKSAKGFRDTLAKWHNADFELAVALDVKSANVKTYKSVIETNNGIIAKIDNGEKAMKTREEYVAEIEDYQARIQAESDTIAELREVQKTRLESAYALLSKELHSAYVGFVKESKRTEYADALCKFLSDNGLEPTIDSIDTFIACVGKKKATTRNKINTGKHNDAFAYTAWRDIFLGELCDVMGENLPIEKFIYKSMEERKQAWENAKNNK